MSATHWHWLIYGSNRRMFVIDRARCDTADCPEERFEIAGTTGNVYSVHIARQPSCNCPHALKGNQCKHVIYVSALFSASVAAVAFHILCSNISY